MKVLLIAALMCAAAGCKKDGAASSSSCADSIGKAVTAMTDKVKGRAPTMAGPMMERMEKLKGALVDRCTTDKWPDAVLKCFETATGRPEMKKCQEALTEDQKMALEADVTKLMLGPMGGRHGSGGPMMGHDDGSGAPAAVGSGSAAAGSAAAGSAAAAGSGSATGW